MCWTLCFEGFVILGDSICCNKRERLELRVFRGGHTHLTFFIALSWDTCTNLVKNTRENNIMAVYIGDDFLI